MLQFRGWKSCTQHMCYRVAPVEAQQRAFVQHAHTWYYFVQIYITFPLVKANLARQLSGWLWGAAARFATKRRVEKLNARGAPVHHPTHWAG